LNFELYDMNYEFR